MARTASSSLSRAYLLAGTVAIGCYVVAPGVAGSAWLFELVGLSAAVAIAVGIAWFRPRPVLPWVLFLIAEVVFVAGDFFYYTYDLLFPAPADGLYIAYYPLQVAGRLSPIRSRSPGRHSASLLDALIISVGSGLLSWIYLIAPTPTTPRTPGWCRASCRWPTRPWTSCSSRWRCPAGPGRQHPYAGLPAPDREHRVPDRHRRGLRHHRAAGQLQPGQRPGRRLARHLHPVGRRCAASFDARAVEPGSGLDDVAHRRPGRGFSPPRPWSRRPRWLAQSSGDFDGFDVPVAAAASAVLFGLVLTRTLGLVASLREAVSRLERAERRERALRRAATALTAAPDRVRIRQAATDGANELMQGVTGVHVAVELSDEAEPSEPETSALEGVVVPLLTRPPPMASWS